MPMHANGLFSLFGRCLLFYSTLLYVLSVHPTIPTLTLPLRVSVLSPGSRFCPNGGNDYDDGCES